MQQIIIRPVITEKSMSEAGKGKYTFVVFQHAHKHSIKKAVEKQFNVTVTNIVTSVLKGRTKRSGQKRVEVKKAPLKKATVTVKSGEKIALFEAGAK
ncbi:MAG: 50S ribosomal protein L23 [Candidatus Levybacteria bacterium]|nr:50S ribosomal protein L23 [Candidatus Levybacteria bacterium]